MMGIVKVDISRRNLIKGIGTAIMAGSAPTFMPFLVGGCGGAVSPGIVKIRNVTGNRIFIANRTPDGKLAFDYQVPPQGEISVVSTDLQHKDFQRVMAHGLLTVVH